VLNDPFENISGKWRERAAELLAELAQTRNALIIIPSLSYRPEAWISNQCVERIEVGQTSQKTIGFGSAGSQSNAQIDEIRNQLRSDPRFAAHGAHSDSRSASAAIAAGVAGAIHTSDLAPSAARITKQKVLLASSGKLLFALIGSSVGGWALFTAVSMYSGQSASLVKQEKVVAVNRQAPESKPLSAPSSNNKPSEPSQQGVNKPPAEAVLVARNKTTDVQAGFLLDAYPAQIKRSILDTARGSIDFQTSPEQAPAEHPTQRRADSGNLFSLLEAASNAKGDSGSANPGSPADLADSEEDSEAADTSGMTPEEAQREAIRNRFLEAIKASALRREAEAAEQMER
jgi:hypothetical protein